ncbi:MAG: hydroxyacylglutathione hydrolase [Deltaproteobacteria bacterium]|nr:hydroxyacylglutathione hydrolase [Deltaproteobacteria bacterium]
MSQYSVEIIPCLADNYAYLITCDRSGAVLCVDPGEGEPVLDALDARGVKLDAVLCTHHHLDHVGGLAVLRGRYGSALRVFAHGSDATRIDGPIEPLEHTQSVRLGQLDVTALHVPAHTTGALAYVVDSAAVFTGDTLFSAGCGRLFEGTAEMMTHALMDTLGALSDDVLMYPGHEYAERNLGFAAMISPGHLPTQARIARVATLRAHGEPAVPSTLGEERETNPFLRLSAEDIRAFARAQAAYSGEDPSAILQVIRSARDRY